MEGQEGIEEEKPVFEIGIAFSKRVGKGDNENSDCIDVLSDELKKMGLIVERILGLQNEFLKVGSSFLFLSFNHALLIPSSKNGANQFR